MKKVLTIAGSDSSGGAGIHADIKTMITNGVYASSVISAITAQNTLGVKSIQEVRPDVFRDQITAVFEDICVDATKIGMMASVEQIKITAELLKKYEARNVVLDPVMIATNGARASTTRECIKVLWQELFVCADLITPNVPEAIYLAEEMGFMEELKKYSSDSSVDEINVDYEVLATKLRDKIGVDVLLKGGHRDSDMATDILATAEGCTIFYGETIDNPNTHGTGCTLSSAIASNLAKRI